MYDWLEEPYYEDWDDERYPHVRARKPFGRIAIANSDAGASANFDSAVTQAHRAVKELS
jgi:spermidine dehydrogenase